MDGWLLYTRFILSLDRAGRFIIQPNDLDEGDEVKFSLLSEAERKTLTQFAKLVRKLRFIQELFNVEFLLPDMISSDELKNAEIVFRGITEGEFVMRSRQFTFSKTPPSNIFLTLPPFDGPGTFSCRIGEPITLFGQEMPVDPATVSFEKAAITNPNLFDQIQKDPNQPMEVRVEVLDNRVAYRFENYAQQSRQYLREAEVNTTPPLSDQ